MIQRIQTVYLFLAILCLVFMFFFPVGLFEAGGMEYKLRVSGLSSAAGEPLEFPANIVLMFTLPFAILVIILQLLYFKKRPRQMRLGRLAYLLLFTLIGSLIYLMNENPTALPETENLKVQYGVSFYLPIAALVFVFLANRAIKKDQELVDSLNRLR